MRWFFLLLMSACSLDRVSHDEAQTCACMARDDVCVSGTCMQRETRCTATSGCSAPYICDADADSCACDPTPGAWEECAPTCDKETPCPDGLDCGAAQRICFPPLQCISDAGCPLGQFCEEGAVLARVVWNGGLGYSLASTIGSTCVAGSSANDSGCAIASDCAAADCVLEQGGAGRCETPRICGDDEFLYASDPTATCYVHEPCRHDEDCEADYRCRLLAAPSSGYCARAA